MVTNVKQIAAGEFKARCLALLDEVAATGEELLVTKRGKPIAKVVPLERKGRPSLRGHVLEMGDLVSPIEVDWDADR